MTPDRWRQIDRLLEAALKRDPVERAAFLAAACASDEELRCEVESLLAVHEPARNFLESPAFKVGAESGVAAEVDFKGTERFLILRRLGAGGFGVVYLAYDREWNALVALKTLRQIDPDALYRFKREFRALADISHRNLVTLYELMSDGVKWFFTMELVEGVSFLEYVHESTASELVNPVTGSATAPGPDFASTQGSETEDLDTRKIHSESPDPVAPQRFSTSTLRLDLLRAALRQLAEGVCALHEAGKLHRDLKPSNVLVTKEGRVVILDFGLIAELLSDEPERMSYAGTPPYMSPEQRAGEAVSEPSDWYGVGVMLYQALAGRLPFTRGLNEIRLKRQQYSTPTLLPQVPGVPEDLNALCQDLLRRDPQARPTGREVLRRLGEVRAEASDYTLAAPSRVRVVTFVGRERHLSVLREAFMTAKRGRSVTVYLHGSSGVGKSTLVRRFLGDLQQHEKDVVVLQGRCYEQESVPYKALDSLVDALSQYLKLLPDEQAQALIPRDVLALARLFPVLRQVKAVAEAQHGVLEVPDSQEIRRRASAALRELLARLAGQKKLVLFVDDLQWGDADSAALLAELLQPPDPPALLLVACYRGEEAGTSPFLKTHLPWRTMTGLPLEIRELAVSELDPTEARDLAEMLLGRKDPVGFARAEMIARESGGSPFFIDELVWYSQSTASGQGGDTTERLVDSGAKVTLDEVIRARVSRLPEAARRLLEVVAVAGQPVGVEAARLASDLGSGEQIALAILRSGRLIRSRETGEQDYIEAYHDRIRETVLAQLPPGGLKTHHHHLALALESSSRPDPETLAIHFQGAEENDKASDYAAIAAAQATDALAFDRAVRLYRLALELRPREPAEGRPLRVKLGEALANAGRGAEASEAYLTAAEGANAAESIDLRRRAAEQLLLSGHVDEGLSVIASVLSGLGMALAATPWQALLPLLWRRAQVRLRGLSFREREATRVPAEQLIRIDTCWSVAQGLSMVDTLRAADFQARHLLLALRSGEKYRIARALAVEAGYYAISGGRERARTQKILQMAVGLAESINHPHAIGLTGLIAGMAAFLEGRWREARDLLERAEWILRERCTGVAWELATAHLMWSVSLFFLGELGELSQRLPTLLKQAEGRGDLYEATELRIRISHAGLLAADEPEEARRGVREAITSWSSREFYLQHWWSLIAETEISLYLRRGVEAWDLVTEQWPALRRSMLLRVQYILIESLHHRAQSALAVAADSRSSDRRAFLQAAERDAARIESERMPWGNPLAWLIRASVASIRGKVEDAVALLASAETEFEAAGMALYTAAARRRRGELIGGDQGKSLIEAADIWMTGQQIKDPSRMTAMLAPGLCSQD